jgi:D-aspartate ligase
MINNCRIDTSTKAVIYPARTVSGYGHIFSLGIAGIYVTALAHGDSPNFKSRYVHEKHIVPDPRVNHEKFIDWLLEYGKSQKTKPVLFMVEDAYAYLASIYREQLENYFLYPYIDQKNVDVFFHKEAMYRTADNAGVRYPTTLFPAPGKKNVEWVHFPAVIKPVISRFKFIGKTFIPVRTFPEIFGTKAVFASTVDELQTYVDLANSAGLECCVQRYIPGENKNLFTVYFVADRSGCIPSFSTHYKVRQYPADFGTTSVSQSKAVPELAEFARLFCQKVSYSGPATMEFKFGSDDGLWYLMEINARLGFSIRRSTVKGVNMPLQQYLLSTGQNLLAFQQIDDRRYWIDIPGDIKGLLWRYKQKEWHLSFWQIIKPYFFFREAVLNIKDPLPGLIRLYESIKRRTKRLIATKIFHTT